MSATIIAVISIVISGIALAGVVISLILQARQLRASLLQASRITHSETIRMAFENPKIVAEAWGLDDPEALAKSAYINWVIQHLRMGFSLKITTPAAVRTEVTRMFRAQFPRDWWTTAQPVL